MKNQFFYTRKEAIQDTDPVEFKEFRDSLNISKVIRSVRMDDENLVVLLDDIHERVKEVPNINTKTNKVIGMKKVSEVFQTEVYLQGSDIERFESITKFE
jgi:hypothetical protein|tara:strand:- start:351 stop:650 length:300 start_codon:yes stop_codon:yes gene_type:complete